MPHLLLWVEEISMNSREQFHKPGEPRAKINRTCPRFRQEIEKWLVSEIMIVNCIYI